MFPSECSRNLILLYLFISRQRSNEIEVGILLSDVIMAHSPTGYQDKRQPPSTTQRKAAMAKVAMAIYCCSSQLLSLLRGTSVTHRSLILTHGASGQAAVSAAILSWEITSQWQALVGPPEAQGPQKLPINTACYHQPGHSCMSLPAALPSCNEDKTSTWIFFFPLGSVSISGLASAAATVT